MAFLRHSGEQAQPESKDSGFRRLYSQPPMEKALLSWLSSDQRRSPDGRVLSWNNEKHPGYPYDEATALLATLFAWQGDGQRADELTRCLEQRIRTASWLGRDGISYVFDSALALPLVGEPEALADRIETSLRARRACSQITRPGWWSQSYGAHLLKCGFWLARIGRRAFAKELAADLVERCFDGTHFVVHEGSNITYLHSHCYALEGLIGLQLHDDVVAAGALWLSEQQGEDGSLPDWFGRSSMCRPADVCAQALRIWALVDRERFAPSMARARAHLESLQDACGGIRYHQDSEDLNSWASMFALQALCWSRQSPGEEELQWLL